MLKQTYVRDGHGKIIGTKTTGFDNGDEVARDEHGCILGHSNSTFNNTRNAQGCLVSNNQADVGPLFRR